MTNIFRYLGGAIKLTLFAVLGFFMGSQIYAQCALGSALGAFNSTTLVDDIRININDTVEAGEYVPFTNVIANKTYVLDVCGDAQNTSLTLFNSAFSAIAFSDDDCGNDGEITFVAPANGTYYVQVNVGACGTNAVDHIVYAERLSCSYPAPANITITQNVACLGDSAILTFGGNLNDALYWVIYNDSCGGGLIDTAFTNTFTFEALEGTRKYFVRGEGACTATFSGCDSVTLTTVYNSAEFTYSASSYCVQAADETPVISGVTGGVFSAVPVGLSLNTTTGGIDMSACAPGTYKVYYTTPGTCTNVDSASVEIIGLDDVTFAYSSGNFCVGGVDPVPNITGVSGGAFTSTPAGLVISSTSGLINLTTSTVGSYTITYTSVGSCPSFSSKTVVINVPDNGGFGYLSTSYCAGDVDPTPTVTGLAGGTFSSTAGLVINASTGIIDLSASTPSFYNVNYTTTGVCAVTVSQGISVNGLDNANFDYGQTIFCLSDSDPLPSVSTSGTFASLPAGLSINTSNGLINIGTSTPASYTVTYTSTGACPNSSSKAITLSSLDDASFSFAGSVYCPLDTDPNASITGLAGGGFTYSPFGLMINSTTGTVDLSASIPKAYSVIYTTTGNCPNTASQPLTINITDDASFNYSNSNFCISSSDPTPVISGLSGGAFTSTPVGLALNATSGLVDISASTLSNYSVTYTTNGTCPNTTSRTFSISSFDDATFNYSSSSFCAFETNTTPVISGSVGGMFSSSPAGLTLSQSTGFINTGASNAGAYSVTYTTSGDCVNSSIESVTIVSADDASFNYSEVEYCDSDSDPIPTIVGQAGGTFTATPSGLVFVSASTGVVDVSASIPGLYTITYTTSGACANTSSQSFVVKESSDAEFSYTSTILCSSGIDPLPSITGFAGGIFTYTPNGLELDPYTGEIDLDLSIVGLYDIVYSVNGDCPNSDTITVTINDIEDANFSFSASNYCNSGIDPIPAISGVTGGNFSALPAGLSISSITGEIDLGLSATGNYSITYLTNGACANSSIESVSISNFDDANFNYTLSNYCADGADPTPVVSGLPGGTFSATPAGLSISPTSGKVDVSASTPGSYSINYLTNGDCPNTGTQSITINQLDDASFNFSSLGYCITESNPTPIVTGALGGVFSASPNGLDIDPSSGLINLANSVVSNYVVTYVTTGACVNNSTQLIEVYNLDNAAFNYGASSFCASDADPIPSISGSFGGVFDAMPPGLVIDAGTGEIDISVSSINSYSVTFTTSGTCPNSSTQTIDMTAFDDASFSYDASSYCLSNTNPIPLITGVSGGVFSNSPSGLSLNVITGEIEPSSSLLGTYLVTYTTIGNCQNSSSQTITITAVDDASFSFGTPNFCEGGVDQLPSITGLSGGVFSATPAGLDIDAITGNVTITSSSVGNYSVLYTTPGSCPTGSTNQFNLLAIPVTSQLLSDCDSSVINGNVYYASQIVRDTLSGVICDSIVNTDLTMNYASSSTDAHSVWCSLDWIDGVTYTTTNNTATHILTNAVGCDSVVQLDLTISSVDITINDGGTSYTANAVNVDYQWLDCNTGFSELIHETYQTFVPTLNGSFAVMITENACTDTSDCVDLFDLGLSPFTSVLSYKVYPNPFSDNISIQSSISADFDVIISNLEGRIVYTNQYANQDFVTLSMAQLESGIYLVKLKSAGSQEVYKLIKQ